MAHITFIHGISNKPPKNKLHEIWLKALASAQTPIDLGAEGVTSEMVYWADVLYENPLAEEEYESAEEIVSAENLTPPKDIPDRDSAESATDEAWLAALEQRLGVVEDEFGDAMPDASAPQNTLSKELERIPLPGPIKDAFLKNFLRDVHHYLFNVEFSPRPGANYHVQTEIRQRLVEALQRGEKKRGPHILVSHSMGTVIAYDCLKRVSDCPAVDALVTLGSPLGIDEVQDKLKPEWTRDEGFPLALKSKAWMNFFDKLDVVSRLDPYLASDFRLAAQQLVHDESQDNGGIWRHDISKYLKGMIVSKAISKLIGL